MSAFLYEKCSAASLLQYCPEHVSWQCLWGAVPLDPPVPGSNLGPGPHHRVVWGAADRSVNTVQINYTTRPRLPVIKKKIGESRLFMLMDIIFAPTWGIYFILRFTFIYVTVYKCLRRWTYFNKQKSADINKWPIFIFYTATYNRKKQTTLYAYLTEEKKKRVHKEKEEYAQV